MMYSRSVGCDRTCIHVCTIACGPEGSPPWCQGSREGGCGLVVEDVRDTWDGVRNTAVVTKATPDGCVIGCCSFAQLPLMDLYYSLNLRALWRM